jgi:hypothetical protein
MKGAGTNEFPTGRNFVLLGITSFLPVGIGRIGIGESGSLGRSAGALKWDFLARQRVPASQISLPADNVVVKRNVAERLQKNREGQNVMSFSCGWGKSSGRHKTVVIFYVK